MRVSKCGGDVGAQAQPATNQFTLDYEHRAVGSSIVIHADCFEWLGRIPENSLHAIVTDPPYGVKEYDFDQIEKRANGNGGIWRIPPSFDGSTRQPLPRFTALNPKERKTVSTFFSEWSKVALHAMRPGAHLFVASNSFLSQLVFSAIVDAGFEFRGQLIRLVQTLRGGDRPKNAEDEFPGVSSLPRGSFEPWGIFRKPLPHGMKVSDCLREFQTGGLRRTPDDKPFTDVIMVGRTPQREKAIVKHPTLKPQALLRRIVHASLPLGVGVLADPFMGSGSTIAAAEALNLQSLGVERYQDYYDLSGNAIVQLSRVVVDDLVDQRSLFQ